jgi:hypothetical protein
VDLALAIEHPIESVFLRQLLLEMGVQFEHGGREMKTFNHGWTRMDTDTRLFLDHLPKGDLRITHPFKGGFVEWEQRVPKGRLKHSQRNGNESRRIIFEGFSRPFGTCEISNLNPAVNCRAIFKSPSGSKSRISLIRVYRCPSVVKLKLPGCGVERDSARRRESVSIMISAARSWHPNRTPVAA